MAMNIKATIVYFRKKTLEKFFDTMSSKNFIKRTRKAITKKEKIYIEFHQN